MQIITPPANVTSLRLADGTDAAPSLAFAKETGTGFRRVDFGAGTHGLEMIINGRLAAQFFATDDGQVFEIGGNGLNRLALASLSSINLFTPTGHMEWEGSAAYFTVTGYILGTALGQTILFQTDASASPATPLAAQSALGTYAQKWLNHLGVQTADVTEGGDFETTTPGHGLLAVSPNGTRYRINVTDAGAVQATAAPGLTVTCNQAAGQADPTTGAPVVFTVVFSAAVTGFTAASVVLGGTAGASNVTITGSGTTYSLAVSGMTGAGTVTCSISAGAAVDAGGNISQASTSTDNTVQYNGGNTITSDNFDRPNQTGLGNGWTILSGTYQIVSNQAQLTTAVGSNDIAYKDTGRSDGTVGIDIIHLANSGLIFRLTDANNYFIVGNGGQSLSRVQNGVVTVLLGYYSLPADGDRCQVVLNGSSITLQNVHPAGGTVTTLGTVTDTFNQTATIHGIVGGAGTPIFDNFAIV